MNKIPSYMETAKQTFHWTQLKMVTHVRRKCYFHLGSTPELDRCPLASHVTHFRLPLQDLLHLIAALDRSKKGNSPKMAGGISERLVMNPCRALHTPG